MRRAIGLVIAGLLGAAAAAATDGPPSTTRELVHQVLPPEVGGVAAALVPSTPDFSISVPGGTATASPGYSAATVVATAISGGFNAAIALSVTGLPVGVTATFAPSTVPAPGGGSATLTLAVGPAVATGSYPLTVSGSGGALLRSVPLSLTVAPLVPVASTIFSDNFEGTFPGSWQIAAFGANATWGRTTYRAFSTTHSVYCAASGSLAAPPGGPYAANMLSRMMYGPFSLVGATAAHANFRYYVKTQATNDTFQFMESTDGIHFWGFKKSGSLSGWQSGEFDFNDALLPSSALGHSQVYFAFIFQSDGSTQLEGAYADDLVITKTAAGATCAVTCGATVPATATTGVATALAGTINATSCTGTPTFAWSFGDGTPAGSGPSPSHAWASPGPYGWQMTASMGGQSCVKSGSVTVSTPVCSLSCGATVPEAGSTRAPVHFHAEATASNCGSAPSYVWTFGDGAGATTADAAHTYATMGAKDWTLAVTAGSGTCNDSGTVNIGQPVHRHLTAQPH